MSHGWSDKDKAIVKAALDRARKRAEDQTLKEFRNQRIDSVEDLWALELKIREWRREVKDRFYFSYESVESLLHEFLKKGWSHWEDLQSLSPERQENIKEGRTSPR